MPSELLLFFLSDCKKHIETVQNAFINIVIVIIIIIIITIISIIYGKLRRCVIADVSSLLVSFVSS